MDNNHLAHPAERLQARIPPDANARVIKEARYEGVFAGLTGGLAAAVLGARLYGFNRKKTIISGILAGVLSGYLFTKAFTDTALAQLRAEEARQRRESEQLSEMEGVLDSKPASK